LSLANKCSTIDEKLRAFCGKSRYTASSENYFVDSMYHNITSSQLQSFAMNEKGQITNILPLVEGRAKKAWVCNTLCKVNDPVLIDRLEKFHQAISTCTLKKIPNLLQKIHTCTIKENMKLGHTHGCYVNTTLCKTTFLVIVFSIIVTFFFFVDAVKMLLRIPVLTIKGGVCGTRPNGPYPLKPQRVSASCVDWGWSGLLSLPALPTGPTPAPRQAQLLLRPPFGYCGDEGDTTLFVALPEVEWRAQALCLGPRHALPGAARVTGVCYKLNSLVSPAPIFSVGPPH